MNTKQFTVKTLIAPTLLALGVATMTSTSMAAVATFDDLILPSAESVFLPGMDTTFTSGGDASFVAEWNETYNCCLSGFTYSNMTDTTTAGFENQYSAITGGGVNGSANYAISNPNLASRVDFSTASNVNGAYFTNTTYTFLAIRDGNDGAGYVKGPFVDGDYFTLTVNGLDNTNNVISTMDISLATGANVVDQWIWTDLSSLGVVSSLEFTLSSSDNGTYGMNTPAYFAMDDLTSVSAVPVPAAAWLFLSGIAGLAGFAQKRRA